MYPSFWISSAHWPNTSISSTSASPLRRVCVRPCSALVPTPKSVVFACGEAGKPLGFALFFHNYSTFLGKPGIYLEDLFVHPEARGRGIGKRLLTCLGKDHRRARLRPVGVGGTRLERAVHRLLQEPGRRVEKRMADFPAHWLGVGRAGGAEELNRPATCNEGQNQRFVGLSLFSFRPWISACTAPNTGIPTMVTDTCHGA